MPSRVALIAACLTVAQAAHAEGDPALFVEASSSFIPYANDITLMFGAGVRFAKVHEVWVRAGYIPTGDDVHLAFGVVGYRAVLRPEHAVRPFFGGLVAGLPETCTHDAQGSQTCTKSALFIFAATGGVRYDPTPWLGLWAGLSLGLDSYPNPFGMVELGVTLAFSRR